MTTTFEFDPSAASSALARLASAPDDASPVAIAGDEWAQAAMGALLQAELLAADAGVVPYLTLPDGTKGIVTVGAARERIDAAPEDVRTIYLATHGIVRSTHAMAKPWSGSAPPLGSVREDLEIGLVPVWVLVVLGVAAIIATATYFIHHDTIEVEGKNLRATAATSAIAGLARDQLAKTGKIDPEIWESLRDIADAERGRSWLPVTIAGVALAGGIGGAFAWRRYRLRRGGARRESP